MSYGKEGKENEIAHWINNYVIMKISFYTGIFIAIAVFIITAIISYYTLFSFNYLWLPLLFSVLTIFVFYLPSIVYWVNRKTNLKYPTYVIFDRESIVLQTTSKRRKRVMYSQIYGITDHVSYILKGLGKSFEVTEFRIYYYDGDRLRWFWVSKSIADRIKIELRKKEYKH